MAIRQGILNIECPEAPEGTACETPKLIDPPQKGQLSSIWRLILLGLAGLNCLFQIIWFWRYTGRNINYDAISYIGIARHIADGDLQASLHGYWSPLISWCIAGISVFSHDFLLAGRIVTIASFLLCLPLLYLLTLRLWSSSTLAALSVLCFTLARGVVAFSVFFIGADFLLTAAVLCYFILLLRCLRNPQPAQWLILGTAHATAFLAKAFAMPLLTIATVLAVLVIHKRNPKQIVVAATRLDTICSIQRPRNLPIKEDSQSLTIPPKTTANIWSWTTCIRDHPSGMYISTRGRLVLRFFTRN